MHIERFKTKDTWTVMHVFDYNLNEIQDIVSCNNFRNNKAVIMCLS